MVAWIGLIYEAGICCSGGLKTTRAVEMIRFTSSDAATPPLASRRLPAPPLSILQSMSSLAAIF